MQNVNRGAGAGMIAMMMWAAVAAVCGDVRRIWHVGSF